VFMRLTCRSITDAPIRRTNAVGVVGSPGFGRGVPPGRCSAVVSAEPCFGGRAPDFSASTSLLSTTTVDTAGWTEVVIQREPQVLSDVMIGSLIAEVNASINFVTGAAPSGLGLKQSGGAEFLGDTDVCRGYSGLKGSSFSCSNNNEVTI
jgi:hypothetical protein